MIAKLLWQLGRWEELCAFLDAPETAQMGAVGPEILALHYQAALETARFERADILAAALRAEGFGSEDLARLALSVAYRNLGRNQLLAQDHKAALRAMRRGAELCPNHAGDGALVADLWLQQAMADRDKSEIAPRSLFIDCGGFDGCSAVQYLIKNPNFDCLTFEPNPNFWPYFEDIPTELQRAAVYTYDGEITFTLDPVDGDGSSVMRDKKIDIGGTVANEECPQIKVACVDLSRIIREKSEKYDRIVLKLDVEGAEYDILERMIADGSVTLVETIHCEFHQNRMEVTAQRHAALVEALGSRLSPFEWDALPFALTVRDNATQRMKRRYHLIGAIRHMRSATDGNLSHLDKMR